MKTVRLARVEIMRAWHRISHSDIPHIQQGLVKVHYSVYTGILETPQTAQEILEDATHSQRRPLSRLPRRCLSPPKGTALQHIPRLGHQLRATSWPRQPFTQLPSLLCLTTGLTLPTLRRSQALTNLRMLRVSVTLNFQTSTDCKSFLVNISWKIHVFVPPAFCTCTYHHHRVAISRTDLIYLSSEFEVTAEETSLSSSQVYAAI